MSSTPIFMRGDPLDLSLTFYMVCTASNEQGYVFSQNQGGAVYYTTTPVAGFLQLSDMYADYPAIQFSIVSVGNNIYTFQPTNLNLTGYCLGINSAGYFDLVEISDSVLTQVTVTIPNDNTDLNIYNLETLYPSLQYALIANDTGTTVPQKFYLFNLTSTNSWEYYTVFPQIVDVMFVPVNNGQLSVWQVNTDYPSGACYYSPSNDALGIEWFYNWVNGTSTGCEGPGPASSLANNCYFTSNNACLNGYLYDYCIGTEICGTCMGVTNTSSIPCMYNAPGSSIPLLMTVNPVATTSTANMVELPDDSNDGCCGGFSSAQAFILFVVILVIVFILIGWYLVKKSSDDKSSQSSNSNPHHMNPNYNPSAPPMDSMMF